MLIVPVDSHLRKVSTNKELANPLDYVITDNQEDIKEACLFFCHEPDIAELVYSREDN
jgi:hypothetical protein